MNDGDSDRFDWRPARAKAQVTGVIGVSDPHRMVLAAKLAARELGPVVIADDGGVWDTDKITTAEEWIAFAQFLRDMIRRKRLS